MRGLSRLFFIAALFAFLAVAANAQGRTTRLSKKCLGLTSSSVVELSTYGNPNIRSCPGVNGGEVRITTGDGIAGIGDPTAGQIYLIGGTGAIDTDAGTGGPITITSGPGGASTVAAGTVSGDGGNITITTGAGGNRTGATGTAGGGGSLSIIAGRGGTGSGGASNGPEGLIYVGDAGRNQRIILDGSLELNRTITAAGTTGARTINKTAGTVNLAAAATSVVVTNSLVTTSSLIFPVVRTADATCTFVKSVVAASGSFTITMNAGCTGETSIGFWMAN